MSTLAIQQQALLNALFAWPPTVAAQDLRSHAQGVGLYPGRGLQVYQANGHVLAERALSVAYPVLAQMLGAESFADLARAYWHAYPPERGDISQWGQDVAEFVRESEQLQEEPYLTVVAQVEWSMHCCASAADGVANLSTLALLTTNDPQTLTLQMAPGWACVSSVWPVGSMLMAHLDGSVTFEEVRDLLHSRITQDVVVWRPGLRPLVRVALPGEVIFLSALQSGLAIEPALQSSVELDFSKWLPMAVQTGFVLGAISLPPTLNLEQK